MTQEVAVIGCTRWAEVMRARLTLNRRSRGRSLVLAVLLVFGLLLGLCALFYRLNSIAFGEPRGATAEAKASYVPMFAHLALV